MSAPDEFPRLVSRLLNNSRGMPVRLEFLEYFPSDNTTCFFIRGNHNEWLTYEGLPPQMIGLVPWSVTLLGGKINAGASHDAATSLGLQRFYRALAVPIDGPYDPDRHLPPPEDSIADEERALDINLVPWGVDPSSRIDQALECYCAKLSLIKEVGTLGSPVGNRDKVLHARRTIFEAEERDRVEALITKEREQYAKKGERIAKLNARARKRS